MKRFIFFLAALIIAAGVVSLQEESFAQTPPAAPQNFTATPVSACGIKLEWEQGEMRLFPGWTF